MEKRLIPCFYPQRHSLSAARLKYKLLGSVQAGGEQTQVELASLSCEDRMICLIYFILFPLLKLIILRTSMMNTHISQRLHNPGTWRPSKDAASVTRSVHTKY